MVDLGSLPKIVTGSRKRVGRGYGSGKGGHTVGRGQKGQKSRSKIGPLFEGTKVKKSLIQRLPMMRGKGRLKPGAKPLAVDAGRLNVLRAGTVVDVPALVKEGLVSREARRVGVKILGNGELEKKLTVKVPASKNAREKIEKAGGKVEV